MADKYRRVEGFVGIGTVRAIRTPRRTEILGKLGIAPAVVIDSGANDAVMRALQAHRRNFNYIQPLPINSGIQRI